MSGIDLDSIFLSVSNEMDYSKLESFFTQKYFQHTAFISFWVTYHTKERKHRNVGVPKNVLDLRIKKNLFVRES